MNELLISPQVERISEQDTAPASVVPSAFRVVIIPTVKSIHAFLVLLSSMGTGGDGAGTAAIDRWPSKPETQWQLPLGSRQLQLLRSEHFV
jgi:hypothetical protein